jgi:hypothetical protein
VRFDAVVAGESGVELSFSTPDGRRHVVPRQGYFENGYEVRIEVTPSLDAAVDATIQADPILCGVWRQELRAQC